MALLIVTPSLLPWILAVYVQGTQSLSDEDKISLSKYSLRSGIGLLAALTYLAQWHTRPDIAFADWHTCKYNSPFPSFIEADQTIQILAGPRDYEMVYSRSICWAGDLSSPTLIQSWCMQSTGNRTGGNVG